MVLSGRAANLPDWQIPFKRFESPRSIQPMEQSTVSPSSVRQSAVFADATVKNESNSSGVSWAAVIGGAFVAPALSLILLARGTGLGLSSVSPWSNVGASASAIGAAAIAWFIVMQILASSFGGYLAGRLRTKWAGIHSDEVYFRDTAHGFLAWAVALVITAAFLATAAAAIVGGATSAASAGSSAASSAANSSCALDPNPYFVDTLFRSDRKMPIRQSGICPSGIHRRPDQRL
jgi:hypothetical protein